MKKLHLSVALSCLNLGRLEEELKSLEEAGCDGLHVDISDGGFVSEFAGGVDTLKAARACSSLPCTAHLMTDNPNRHIQQFVDAGCAGITVHLESCRHAHRTLTSIREAGLSPGVAITPATPLTKMEYVLNLCDRVLILGREPGQQGDAVAPGTFERVRILKENILYRELSVVVEVEGIRTVTDVAVVANEGADAVVVDSADMLGGAVAGEGVDGFREGVEAKRKVV